MTVNKKKKLKVTSRYTKSYKLMKRLKEVEF